LINFKRIGAISTDKEELSELEKLRLEMVEELRKVREDLRQSSSQTTELVTEMKQMN
jgi:deoxyhypusine synthase